MRFMERVQFKPECKLIGENGNIFNLIAIAKRTLIENGKRQEADELVSRIIEKGEAGSYEEALTIIMDYVDVV